MTQGHSLDPRMTRGKYFRRIARGAFQCCLLIPCCGWIGELTVTKSDVERTRFDEEWKSRVHISLRKSRDIQNVFAIGLFREELLRLFSSQGHVCLHGVQVRRDITIWFRRNPFDHVVTRFWVPSDTARPRTSPMIRSRIDRLSYPSVIVSFSLMRGGRSS